MQSHEAFGLPDRLAVEGGYSSRKLLDVRFEFLIGNGTVDPSVAFGEGRVEVIRAEDDLGRAAVPSDAVSAGGVQGKCANGYVLKGADKKSFLFSWKLGLR
jgi:hypothetical protein